MLEAKYIRTRTHEIIIFPAHMAHSQFKHFNPVSAGFVRFETQWHENLMEMESHIVPKCYGRSESLGLESMEEDSELVHRQITRSGLY